MSLQQTLGYPTNRVTNILLAVIAVALIGILLRLSNPTTQTTVLSQAGASGDAKAPGRYQLQKVNDNNVFVIDTESGKVWRQFVESNGGPTEWQGTDPTKAVMILPNNSSPDAGTAIPSRTAAPVIGEGIAVP